MMPKNEPHRKAWKKNTRSIRVYTVKAVIPS